MRVLRWVGAMVLVLVVSTAGPAFAKGEHGSVTVTGPGLDEPIVLERDDALTWEASGAYWQPKWSEPNVAGSLTPGADLGPGYEAEISFGPECRGDVVRQVLYPFAEGGAQVLTPPGQAMCGSELTVGYWPAEADLVPWLQSRGLPAANAVEGNPVSDERGGGGSAAPLIAGILVVLALLAAGYAERARRRPALG